MFDAPSVAEEDKQLCGNTGTEVVSPCQRYGSVTTIGVIGLEPKHLKHDCSVCLSLIDEFGTCEYMHQANPRVCTCRFTAPVVKQSRQTVLETESTVRTRVRFWMEWSRTEGRRLGLTCEPQPAPNLLKTDGQEGSSEN
jgi:hypothetical protein